MRFVIWDSLSGGSCVWSGWGTGGSNGCSSPNGSQVSVTPVNGVFSLALGDTTVSSQVALQNTIFNDDSRYLEIQMYNGGSWETLSPRKRILAAPYAMNSNMLAGLSTSASGGSVAFVPVTDSSGKLTLTAGTTVSGALISLNDTSNFNTQINTGTSTGTVTIGNTGYAGAVGVLSHAALTLTGGAASSWGTSVGNLNLYAAGSGTGSVIIGSGVGSSTPDLFILDNKNDNATDPSGSAGAMYYNSNAGVFRCYQGAGWTNCIGSGGGARLDQVAAATTTATIANANNAITWNWGTLTNQFGLTLGGGTAMTTGSTLRINASTFVHTIAETGEAAEVIFADNSTNNNVSTSVTNGIHVGSSISTSGQGLKSVNAFTANAPTLTGCSGGACAWSGFNVNTQATGALSTITQNGLNIAGAGISAGTLNGINIGAITGSTGVENAIAIGGGWDTSITTLANADLNIYPNGSGSTVIKTDADSFFKVTAVGVPGQDMIQITNAGQPVVAPGVSGIQLTYVGGAATVEASAERIDITGGTSAGAGAIWNGLRIVQGTITPGTTVSDIKLETYALSQSTTDTTVINGLNMPTSGALALNAAGSLTWNGANIQMPNISQTSGAIVTSGVAVTTGTINFGGTQNGLNIIAAGVAYGTLNGINIGAISSGFGAETALNIGAGWDKGIAIATADNTGSGLVITTAGGGTPTAFSVGPNGTVNPAFNIDTTNAANLVTNPSFEVNTAGWVAKGTNPTIARVTTQAIAGGASLLVNNTAGSPAAGDGVKYNYLFTGGNTYALSFYAKLDPTSKPFASATAPYNDFAAGYYNGTADTDCALSPNQDQQAVSATQWNHYSCTFTPGSINQYFYIRQTDNMAGHMYFIDGVQLEVASQPTSYHESTVSFGASMLKVQGLNNCNRLTTDATGTVICGNGLVNNIPLVIGFGHSVMRALYAATNGATNGYNRYLARLANMLHAQEINHAVDGSQSFLANNVGVGGGYAYMLQNTVPPRNQAFAPGQTGPTAPYLGSNNLGVLQYGINDVYLLTANRGAGTAYDSAGCSAYNYFSCTLEDSKEAMRTMIAREQASAVFEEDTNNLSPTASPTAVFYSGTNSRVLTTAQNSGAGYQQFTTAGSATVCLPLDLNATGGTVDIGILADTSGNGATHTISLDGTTVATVNTVGLLNMSGAAATTPTNLSIVRRIKVPQGNASGTTGCLAAGTQHKIVDNITAVTGSTGFDYYQIEATTPVPTLVINTARQTNYSYQGNRINDNDVNFENNAISDVISEFPSTVMSVDEDSALGKNPDNWSTDLVHPNDKGHALIAEAAYQTLESMPGNARQTTLGLAAGNTTQTIETVNYGIYNTDYQPTLLINTTPTNPGNIANSITNPGFEFDSSGWGVFIGSINRVATQNYTGAGSLQVVTNPVAPYSGPYWNWAFPDTNPFTFSFYAKLDAASPAFTTLAAGYYDSGSAWHACSLNSNTVVATGWTRYYCTFSTTSGSVFPSIVDSSSGGGAKTFYVDDVLLQETSTLNNWDEGGSISLVGNVVSPVQFQNTSNSTTAFQINDAAGNVLMSANTVTDNVSFTTTGLAQTTTAVTTLNPVSVSATGAISQTTNTGTINWLGNLITTPATTINVAGGTILNDGLKIVQGAYNVNTTNGAAGGMNGIDIAGGTMSTLAAQTGTISDINLTTALLASSTTGINNVNGIYLSSAGALSTATNAGVVNWDGVIINPPAATVGIIGSTVTSNGFDVNASNLTMSANGTGNVYGIDLAMGTLTANGTGGVIDGILIAGPAIAGTSTAAGTVNDVAMTTAILSLSTATTQNIYGWNLSAAGNITTTSTGTINWTGSNIVMPNITQGAGSTIASNGLSVTSGTITTGGTMNDINIVGGTAGAGTENGININTIANGAGTENAIAIGGGWDTSITTLANANLVIQPNGSGKTVFNVDADSPVSIAATAVPGLDMLNITNSGFPAVGVGVNALSINYFGGNANVESGAFRIDLTPGGTAGATWNGFRIVPASVTPSTTQNNIKLETPIFAQTTAVTTNINGLNIPTVGAISQASNAGTINWAGVNITTPAATLNYALSTILNDGIKISTGTFAQSTTGTGTSNGVDISVGALTATAAGGTSNGISIVGGSIVATSTAASTTNGIALTTAGLALTTATVQTVTGINLTSAGAISTGSTTGTVNWDGVVMNPPAATVGYVGSTVTMNGFDINSSNLTMSANGTGNVYGIDLAIGTLTANGTGGVMDGILITGPAIAGASTAAGTVNGIAITTAALSLSTATTQNIYGLNLSAPGNITTTSTGTINWQGVGITMPPIMQTSGTINADGLHIITNTVTTGGLVRAINVVDASNNSIFEVRDTSTNDNNFGGLAMTGAFVSRDSYWGDEFSNFRTTNTVTSVAEVRGDYYPGAVTTAPAQNAVGSGEISTNATVGTSGVCTFSSVNQINGIEQIQPTTVGTTAPGSTCLEYRSTGTAGTLLNQYQTGNLPVIVMKIAPSVAVTGSQRLWAGISDSVAAWATAPANAVMFSNCSNATPTCDNNWHGITRSASGTVSTVNCGLAVLANKFAYLRIEVRSATDIHFFVDNDVSNGITETECGTGITTNTPVGTVNMSMSIENQVLNAGTTYTLQVDYFRSWQDDSIASNDSNTTVAPVQVVSAPSVFDGRVALADLMTANENLAYDTSAHLDTQVLNASEGVISPLVVATGLIVDSVSSLKDAIAFNSDMFFFGRPYFNADTAGFAIISKGLQAVKVLFEKEYLDKPVVSAAISVDHNDDQSAEQAQISNALNSDMRYVVADSSTKGFTIMLNKPATSDIQFNWFALAVKDAKTFASDPNVQQTFGYQAPPVNSQTTVAPPPVPAPTTPDTNTPAPVANEPAPTPPVDQTPAATQPVATEPTTDTSIPTAATASPDISTPTATTAAPDTTAAPITTSTTPAPEQTLGAEQATTP